MVELVDTQDLKSCLFGGAGSIPAPGTKKLLTYLSVMLKIRFARAGKKKQAFFHIVLTEHTRPVQYGYQTKLGWYNPHTKDYQLDVDTAKKHISHGAQLSDSVKKMLEKKNVTL